MQLRLFNAYFGSIYTKDNDITPPFVRRQIERLFDDDIVVFGIHTIKKIVHTLSDSHSGGSGGFSSFLHRKLNRNISLPFSIIFTQSYTCGAIPDDWKCAVVCPVYKDYGSKSNFANYRPISLTCVSCKIMQNYGVYYYACNARPS